MPKPAVRDDRPGSQWPAVASFQCPADITTPARRAVTHSFAALAFYTGGHARLEQQGEWTLRAGDALVVPAGMAHRALESKDPRFWGLQLCVPCFVALGNTAVLEPFERVRDGAAAVVRIPERARPFLESLFRKLADVSGEAGEEMTAVQVSLVTLILAEIGGAARAEMPEVGAGVVARSLRYIERNCLGPLTVRDVAEAMDRSATYLTTAITEATGRSASKWIVAGRMAEARRLLVHSDEMVEVIAERVGYADSTHFIRMFRREHGQTPAAWRTAQATTVRE